MACRRVAALVALLLAVAGTVHAQTLPAPSRLNLTFSAGTDFDTNIDHDLADRADYGGVIGAGVRYRSRPVNPAFQVTYEAALHSYVHTNRWNRVSQLARVAWQTSLPGPWKFEAVGEVSLKGSSEDRELGDQAIVQPRLEYRLSETRRLRLYAGYRVRRYADEPLRNAHNPMAGVELQQRSARGDRLELGVRYDDNRATGARYKYYRWTAEAGFVTALTRRDQLEAELTLRHQRYPQRLVDVGDRDAPRADRRWIPTIAWTHTAYGDLESRFEYKFESRHSNDVDRIFRSHLLSVRVTQRW